MSKYQRDRLANKLYRIVFELGHDVTRLDVANRPTTARALNEAREQLRFIASVIQD